MQNDLQIYLQPAEFLDSDSPNIVRFVESCCADKTIQAEKAIALFYVVRDGIRYDPYRMELTKHSLKASTVLDKKYGFCVPKAVLLAAAARAAGISSRLGFADVRNHLTSKRLQERMKTDIFVFHAYTEMFLDGRWVKATPAFNLSLCTIAGVRPLEFDGIHDSLLQEFDLKGNKHMEYIRERGSYADLPYVELINAFSEAYPHVMERGGIEIDGSFENETERIGT